MTSASGRDAKASAPWLAGKHVDWAIAALVFAALMAYSSLARPVPSVNEPHYLCKAKHYWQPEWCEQDFFLNSSNPHWVFYQTIGVLTIWLSLPVAAWTGRVLVLALLAWGWTRLLWQLLPQRWAPLGTMCLFLLLQALGDFSGEWLVGGVESKVIAYALALAGMSYVIERRPIPAGACLGAAISFHPLVGSWCLIALVMAAGLRAILMPRLDMSASVDGESPSGKSWLIGAGLLVGCALPGLIPALQMLGNADPEAVARADRIQVELRLAHHLDPLTFPLTAYRYYGLLIILWWLTRRTAPRTGAWLWFVCFVAAATVIALVGVLVGWGPRPLEEMPLAETRIWLLKFYPFRLADVLIPMLVSGTVWQSLSQWAQAGNDSLGRRWAGRLAPAAALGLALVLPAPDRNPSRMPEQREADWRAACAWIRAETPSEALLYATDDNWAVKWFAHRAEYVNYKDCPQDAVGIVKWVDRLKELKVWGRTAFRDGRCSAQELRMLHEQTRITHLLVDRRRRIDVPPVYQNDSFGVYQTVE